MRRTDLLQGDGVPAQDQGAQGRPEEDGEDGGAQGGGRNQVGDRDVAGVHADPRD